MSRHKPPSSYAPAPFPDDHWVPKLLADHRQLILSVFRHFHLYQQEDDLAQQLAIKVHRHPELMGYSEARKRAWLRVTARRTAIDFILFIRRERGWIRCYVARRGSEIEVTSSRDDPARNSKLWLRGEFFCRKIVGLSGRGADRFAREFEIKPILVKEAIKSLREDRSPDKD